MRVKQIKKDLMRKQVRERQSIKNVLSSNKETERERGERVKREKKTKRTRTIEIEIYIHI